MHSVAALTPVGWCDVMCGYSAMGQDQDSGPAWILETVLDCIFFMDILLNFRTTFASTNHEVRVEPQLQCPTPCVAEMLTHVRPCACVLHSSRLLCRR